MIKYYPVCGATVLLPCGLRSSNVYLIIITIFHIFSFRVMQYSLLDNCSLVLKINQFDWILLTTIELQDLWLYEDSHLYKVFYLLPLIRRRLGNVFLMSNITINNTNSSNCICLVSHRLWKYISHAILNNVASAIECFSST